MKVEMLNVGWLTAPAALWRQGDDPHRPQRIPIPAWLIEADGERILVDTGLSPPAVSDPAAHYGDATARIFSFEQEASVAEQVDVATLTRVVLTHLHFDHAGGLSLLPRAVPIVVQRREWEAGHHDAAIARNFYLPVDYAASDAKVVLVDGEHDLLGDGSIRLLPTPGHTPGHQSVVVAAAGAAGESLVIGGDVVHYATSLDDKRLPSIGDDHAAQGESVERLRGLRDAGASVMPGHDPEVLKPGLVAVGA
jgi:glyoxylase-like metal-dependent hydrolase (beta-lactamase superfamily II)